MRQQPGSKSLAVMDIAIAVDYHVGHWRLTAANEVFTLIDWTQGTLDLSLL